MSALPPVPSDVLSAFRQRPGRALMLGHVHPDAVVLGTLLATGLALEKAGWSVVYGGPHPAPASRNDRSTWRFKAAARTALSHGAC